MAFTTIYQNWHKCVFTTIGTLQTIYAPTYPHANVYQKWHKFVFTGIGIYEYLPELANTSTCIYQNWHIRVSTNIGIYEYLPELAYTSIYQKWYINPMQMSTKNGTNLFLPKSIYAIFGILWFPKYAKNGTKTYLVILVEILIVIILHRSSRK